MNAINTNKKETATCADEESAFFKIFGFTVVVTASVTSSVTSVSSVLTAGDNLLVVTSFLVIVEVSVSSVSTTVVVDFVVQQL